MSAIKPYEPQRTVMEEAVILLLQDLHKRKNNPKTSSVVRRKAESLLDALGAPYMFQAGTENGQNADMSEKEAACVREGCEVSEDEPTRTELEPDTREKLEEEIHDWAVRSDAVFPKSREARILGWLDRQAAITERVITSTGVADWCQSCELQAQVDELTAENRWLQDKVDDLDKENAILVEMASEAAEDAANFEQLLADTESTHMKLPLDDDGVPIRLGDSVTASSIEGAVAAIDMRDNGFCYIGIRPTGWDTPTVYTAEECRHVKPDTLEILLQDLADEVWEASCTCQTTWSDSGLDGIAERYAERIRQSIESERN